jgi:hypothetical protein
VAGEPGFQNYHRLLNRARWSARQAAHVLLKLLVEAFAPEGPVILGLDDTVERRRGRKLTARAIYYDAARSSKACFQKRERLTLDVRGLAGAGALGGPGLGVTVPEGPVPFGTLRPLRAPARPAGPAATQGRTGAEADRTAPGRPHPRWQTCQLPWYGGQIRRLQLASGTAGWYRSGKPPVAIRSRAGTRPQTAFRTPRVPFDRPDIVGPPDRHLLHAALSRWRPRSKKPASTWA